VLVVDFGSKAFLSQPSTGSIEGSGRFGQEKLLFFRWKKFCLQGDLHSSYSTAEVACLKTRAFLPGLKAGASCALKQGEFF
jgi:hypothetical protein